MRNRLDWLGVREIEEDPHFDWQKVQASWENRKVFTI